MLEEEKEEKLVQEKYSATQKTQEAFVDKRGRWGKRYQYFVRMEQFSS